MTSTQTRSKTRHTSKIDTATPSTSSPPDGSACEPTKAPWEKVLWRKQPYADNYVPPSFLAELNDLPTRPRPRIASLLVAALPVTQHLASIALFLAVFYALLEGHLGAGQVGWGCVAVGLAGHGVYHHGWGDTTPQDLKGILPPPTPLRQLILPPLLLSLLSPVLASLTSATSSDSIWPLAGLMFFVHVLLADFSTGIDQRRRRREKRLRKEKERRGSVGSISRDIVLEEKSLTSSLSLTSALSGSVVLASRLPSTSHVFSLLLMSVLLFAGWPNIAKGVREAGTVFSVALTGSMTVLALSFFPPARDGPGKGAAAASATAAPTIDGPKAVFLVVIVLVNVVGPLGLWFAWRWKMTREGGWDAAKVTLRKRRMSMGR